MVLSVYFGNHLSSVDTTTALLILNALNLLVAVFEAYDLIKRADIIVKLEGYYKLIFYYPAMILFNGYKENDIYLDLIFINTLQVSNDFPVLLPLAKGVLYITLLPRVIALIYLVLFIITEWKNIPKT